MRSFVVVVLFTLGGLLPAAAAAEQRVALVVGNGAYQHGTPLRNPVNDATAMAAALEGFGFEVIRVANADRGRMGRALGEFRAKLRADGVGLFFYAGHGIQVNGVNYLIPVEAEIKEELDASYSGIDVQQVLRTMENAGSRLSMVFLDACRDNPFERAFRSVGPRGLAAIDAPRGSLIAYATAPGKTAADGEGTHGLFTAELLKAMAQPGLSIDDVLKRAGSGVERASGNKQVPWVNSSFRGQFFFLAPTTVNIAAPTPPPGLSREMQEQAAWDAVKGSAAAATFEAFLRRFPDGIYADIARAKADELRPAKPPQQALLTPPPAPAPAPAPSMAVQELDATFVALRTAKVRAQPAATAKELGTLGPDTPVAVTGKLKDKDWLRVAWKDGTGYVSAPLLKEVDATEVAAWGKVRSSSRAPELEGFLKAHPKGYFAERAGALLAILRAPPPPAPAPSVAPVRPAAVRPPVVVPDAAVRSAALMCPAPGTVIDTGVGMLTFTGGDGLVCRYINKDGNNASRWAAVWAPGEDLVTQHGDQLKALWPLEVGKSVQVLQNSWFYTYTVSRKEQITVPAGTYDTFVIERRHENAGHLCLTVYWYAPKVSYLVKHRFEVKSGTTARPPVDWDAQSIKLGTN